MIIIAMTGENIVAHLDGLGGTPVAHHWPSMTQRNGDHCAKGFYHIKRTVVDNRQGVFLKFRGSAWGSM
jgi:hypothetical protein